LALAIAGDNATPQRLYAALCLAEAILELRRIDIVKLMLLEATRRANIKSSDNQTSEEASGSLEEYAAAFIRAHRDLVKAERYERRATSQLRTAFRSYAIAEEKG
jgi:phosphoketolase